MTAMAIESSKSPRRAEANAATIRMTIMVEVNCSHRIVQGLLPPLSSSSLGPRSSSRRVASSALSPHSASVPKAHSTSATPDVCHVPLSPRKFLSIRRVPPLPPSRPGFTSLSAPSKHRLNRQEFPRWFEVRYWEKLSEPMSSETRAVRLTVILFSVRLPVASRMHLWRRSGARLLLHAEQRGVELKLVGDETG